MRPNTPKASGPVESVYAPARCVSRVKNPSAVASQPWRGAPLSPLGTGIHFSPSSLPKRFDCKGDHSVGAGASGGGPSCAMAVPTAVDTSMSATPLRPSSFEILDMTMILLLRISE